MFTEPFCLADSEIDLDQFPALTDVIQSTEHLHVTSNPPSGGTDEPDVALFPLTEDGVRGARESDRPVIFVNQDPEQIPSVDCFSVDPVAIITDPTNPELIELRLREARHELMNRHLKQRAMNTAPVGITIARAQETDNPLIYVNDGFLEITGYTRDEIIGKDCRLLQGEDTDPEPVEEIREAIQEERNITTQLLNYRKNGEPFWNRLSISPIRNHDGTVTHYVGIQEDVTVEKQQEAKLRRARIMSAVGDMSAGLMHEINNPNAVVKGNVKFLGQHWDKIHDALSGEREPDESLLSKADEFRDAIDSIRDSSRRIEQIVDRIKVFARRAPQGFEMTAINPDEAVRGAVSDTRDGNDTELSLDLETPSETRVMADELVLRRVVKNLVDNAIEACVHRADPVVQISSQTRDDEYVLRVVDNGDGIPEEHEDRVFEPFFTTKHDSDHIGLGCALASAMVDQMHGTINFESDEDGTVFTVRLPLAD
jgi:PAS domain S-box-containing protein